MSKKVTINDGYILLKDFCPYGVKTEIQNKMYENCEIDPIKQSVKNLKFNSIMAAKELAAIHLVEEVNIKEEKKEISKELLNSLSVKDAEKIINEAWKLYDDATESIPKG